MAATVSVNEMKKQLPFDGKRVEVVSDKDQDTDQIMKYMKLEYVKDKKHYDEIAEPVWQGDVEDTAKMLFDVCKKHITYVIEPEKDQTTKTPGRILHDQHGDCKHYALFITGNANALERMGYPIHARFRYVADKPGLEVHHVFAVITDKETGNEYWVDPVLPRFDERPNFHEIKDAVMSGIGAISMLSGTHGDRNVAMVGSENVAMVGKARKHKKVRNIFKELGHGLKNAEKGVVHLAKGEIMDVKNAAKGVKKLAKGAVKDLANATHFVLKVADTPARNAFLALLDLNFENMAVGLHRSLQAGKGSGIERTWAKLGGNKNKLAQAIANGYRHAQRHGHVGDPISPLNDSDTDSSDTDPNDTDDQDDAPSTPAAATTPANPAPAGKKTDFLSVMASAIINIFRAYLGLPPAAMQRISLAAQRGSLAMAQNAHHGIETHNKSDADAAALKTLTRSGNPSMSVSTGVDGDGNPVLNVHDVSHPALDAAGGPDGGAANAPDSAGDDGSSGDGDNDDKTPPDIAGSIMTRIKEVWTDYKAPIILGLVGVGAYKVYSKPSRKGKK